MTEHPIPEQPEDVRGAPIAIVIASTVIAIVIGAIVVWALDGARLAGGGRSDRVSLATHPPAAPFAGSGPQELRREAQDRALHGWTWAGPAHERVVVPVDVAIDRYLAARGGK